jgi:tetratricopeptide (TPR) repeat protein
LPCLLLLAGAAGCGAARRGEPVQRTLGGRPTQGSFVPPFAYEAYVRGEIALAQGRPDEAVTHFELATAAPDEDAYLLSRLAYAHALAGRPELAERTLRHAEEIDSCSEALWLTRAEIAEHAKDLPRARDAYAKAAACAPLSPRGVLGLAHVLDREGSSARAIEVLERFAQSHPEAPRVPETAFELALRSGDGAVVAHAIDTWLSLSPPRSRTLERAVEWALEKDLPELSLRLYEHAPAADRPELECRIHVARGDRERVRAVLVRADAQSLGGHARAAELALFAGAYERAELEASSLLFQGPSDRGRVLRARARSALGRATEAAADAMAVEDATLRKQIALELLSESGAPKLAAELESLTPGTKPERSKAQ